MAEKKPSTTYVSNGRTLTTPPLSVRAQRFFEAIYAFVGLYFVTLFSFDPYRAAENSQFNIHRVQRTGPFGASGEGSIGNLRGGIRTRPMNPTSKFGSCSSGGCG